MVARTVQQYARAGVAGLHIEDQVQTKRCGHLLGKQVVSREEFITRIRAAVLARDAIPGSDLVIIGRTDSAQVLGMEEAIYRLKLAANAGADVCFIEGVKTKELLESTVAALAPKPVRINPWHYTLFSNNLLSGSCQRHLGRSYAIIHNKGSRKNGRQDHQYVLFLSSPHHLIDGSAVFSLVSCVAAVHGIRDAMRSLKKTGTDFTSAKGME